MDKIYICIDLKTFFASVECVERSLDPFTTNLVVADETRGNGTICLAVSPRMKELGVRNRCRVFEIPKNVKYIMAKPRMKKYIEYSANIYSIYLKYFAKEDIHVYSIDEVFIDVTPYLKIYKMSAIELTKGILKDIFDTYKITATAGIGTNLYLAKVAMDIIAKHSRINIGYLDEKKYQEILWHHRPISDFWQVGRGIEKRLKKHMINDMYDVAHVNPKILYKEFGVNAEFLIDHAWGRETCTIADIKAYKPKYNSISTNQVLFEDYRIDKARLVLKEMIELKVLELVENDLIADTIELYIGYSNNVIKSTGGAYKLPYASNSLKELTKYFLILFDKTTNIFTPIRRIGIAFCKVKRREYEQLSIFKNQDELRREESIEKAILKVKKEFGKNAIIKGMNLEAGATTLIRNSLIGGHNGE